MSPWAAVGALLVITVVVVEVVVPRIVELGVERNLARDGGEAFVAIASFPAARLLRRSGDRIEVRGTRLVIGMAGEGGGLSVLDGFREVDIVLTEFVTGPFEVAELELSRVGEGPYVMRARAHTSGSSLADFGGEGLGALGPILAVVARQAPLGGRSFPVSVEVELASEEGLLTVASGGGTIAGAPAGPFASMLAAAVARRLEIAY